MSSSTQFKNTTATSMALASMHSSTTSQVTFTVSPAAGERMKQSRARRQPNLEALRRSTRATKNAEAKLKNIKNKTKVVSPTSSESSKNGTKTCIIILNVSPAALAKIIESNVFVLVFKLSPATLAKIEASKARYQTRTKALKHVSRVTKSAQDTLGANTNTNTAQPTPADPIDPILTDRESTPEAFPGAQRANLESLVNAAFGSNLNPAQPTSANPAYFSSSRESTPELSPAAQQAKAEWLAKMARKERTKPVWDRRLIFRRTLDKYVDRSASFVPCLVPADQLADLNTFLSQLFELWSAAFDVLDMEWLPTWNAYFAEGDYMERRQFCWDLKQLVEMKCARENLDLWELKRRGEEWDSRLCWDLVCESASRVFDIKDEEDKYCLLPRGGTAQECMDRFVHFYMSVPK